jgi:hypothetical protein
MWKYIGAALAILLGFLLGASLWSAGVMILTGQETSDQLAYIIGGGSGSITAIFLTKKWGWH